jgi:hypothetical protein
MQRDVDDCSVSMHLDESAAVDGPYQTGATGIVERPLGHTTEQQGPLAHRHFTFVPKGDFCTAKKLYARSLHNSPRAPSWDRGRESDCLECGKSVG